MMKNMKKMANQPPLLTLSLHPVPQSLHISPWTPRFVLASSVVFVEASHRVKELLTKIKDIDTTIIRKLHSIHIQHYKSVLYYVENNKVFIIDDTFKDMFTTAYVHINGLPNTFIGSLEDYNICVYLLYKQLKWNFEEHDLFLSKFRVDIINRLLQLSQQDLLHKLY